MSIEKTAYFCEGSTFCAEMSINDTGEFNTGMQQITEVVTSDHSKLKNRDMEDQHPIKAISNLTTELERKVKTSDVITNTEIEKILGGL